MVGSPQHEPFSFLPFQNHRLSFLGLTRALGLAIRAGFDRERHLQKTWRRES